MYMPTIGRHVKLILQSDASKFGMVQHQQQKCQHAAFHAKIALLKCLCFTLDHPFLLCAKQPPIGLVLDRSFSIPIWMSIVYTVHSIYCWTAVGESFAHQWSSQQAKFQTI